MRWNKRLTRRIYLTVKRLESLRPGMRIPPDRPGNIVMFHAGRTGSTVLAHMLAAHPCIFWDFEIFSPHHGLWREQMKPTRFLCRRMGRAGRSFYGFECRIDGSPTFGLDLPDLVDHLATLGFSRYVVMLRRNTLRTIVSRTVTRSGGQSRRRPCEPARLRRVKIDVNRAWYGDGRYPLLTALANADRLSAEIGRAVARRECLELSYEDDIESDPAVAYRKVCKYLDIVPAEPRVVLGRVNPYPIREIVENFDEVAALVADTPYAWMLED